MRLVKIKNKYLFNSDKPEKTHTYAVYYDRKNKENRAVSLTHLYIEDEKRFRQLKKNNIKKMKFGIFELPTGVQNYYYASDIYGKKINLLDKNNVTWIQKKHLSKNKSDEIKKFARYRVEKGKRKP